MEPNIPTSFIPKSSASSGGFRSPSLGVDSNKNSSTQSSGPKFVGLLSFITTIVVIATILSFVGVYLYEQRLGSQKQTLEQSINDARTDLGSDFVAEMQRLEQRILGVRTLLSSHVVVSPIFEELQQKTLRSVQFSGFKYDIQTDQQTNRQMVNVTLKGLALNYSIVALQSDALSQSTLIKNPVFSNLSVDDQTKRINFSLTFSVDAADLSYQKFIEKRNSNIQQNPEIQSVILQQELQ